MRKIAFIILAVLCFVMQEAWAQSDPTYIERSWNGSEVVEVEKTAPGNSHAPFGYWKGEDLEMYRHYTYYVVAAPDDEMKTLTVFGNKCIILKDGCKLTCKCIEFAEEGSSLTIYAQKEGTGELIIDATDTDRPGIEGGRITIHGGKLTVKGDTDCAGIGGRDGNAAGEITIYGGHIEARGGKYGAGIGGGQNGNGGNVTIYGGYVYADGGVDAAGIGSGEQTSGTRNGGSLTVYGGHVYADGTDWGAGIGGGEDADGATVKIYGGIVEAWAGQDAGNKNGSAIGSEDGDGHRGSLSIADHMMVHAGQNPSDANGHLFSYGERVPACYFRPYTRIEPCDHQGATYTVSGTLATDTHTRNCSHCLDRSTDTHAFADGTTTCTVCGVSGEVCTVSIYLPEAVNGSYTDGHYATTARTQQVVKGTTINLPAPPVTYLPNGVSFAGWAVGTPTELGLTSYWKDGEETVLASETPYPVGQNISLTARYTGIDISLANAGDNGEIIYLNDGKKAQSVTLAGRTLFKDDAWNTLCLPFNMSAEQIAAHPQFADAQLKTLGSSSYNSETGALTINFTTATSIEAGVPYLVKWAPGADIESPVFNSVTIHSTATTTTTDYIDFVGIYAPEVIYQGGDRTKLYMGSDNTLYYATTEGLTLNSCRAYFLLKEGLVAENVSGDTSVNSFTLHFDEPDGIKDIERPTDNGQWYTLDGRRLSGKPTAKGLYIHNGKAVVVKK